MNNQHPVQQDSTDTSRQSFGKLYWDEVIEKIHDEAPINEWRYYMRSVYRRLLRNWVKDIDRGRGLKTDLFEEAISPYHLLSEMSSESIGLDYSTKIAEAAYRRFENSTRRPSIVVGDLRRLPFKSGLFQYILSGSSLDHFTDQSHIAISLGELSRVLAQRGVMVITFDNPHNPVVCLRNHLPFAWLNRMKLVPYFVGATYTRSEARRQLAAADLSVTHMTAVAHAPRALAIWLVTLAERLSWPRLEILIRRVLQSFECLEHLPTRYYTGYYIALRVEKPDSPVATQRERYDG